MLATMGHLRDESLNKRRNKVRFHRTTVRNHCVEKDLAFADYSDRGYKYVRVILVKHNFLDFYSTSNFKFKSTCVPLADRLYSFIVDD